MEKFQIMFERNPSGITEILSNATIGIAGCGGLGSNAAVALARSGVGNMILADSDTVEESNLNRQSYTRSDIGRKKTEALSDYLKNINPDIRLVLSSEKIIPENVEHIFREADLLIEALDSAESKAWIIESWCSAFPDRPVIGGSGLAGYGGTDDLKARRAGNVVICGDGKSDESIGLCGARVAIVAAMQANEAVRLLVEKGRRRILAPRR